MVHITLISIFINFFACFLLSLLFASLGKKYHKFALFNLNVSAWSFFYGSYIVANSYEEALIYSKLTSVCLVLIPYLFFNAAVGISNITLKPLYHKINGLTAAVMSILMLTPVMIKGVKPYLDFDYIPDITIYYYVYPLYYTALIVAGLSMMHSAIKSDYKIRIMFAGFSIGFIGGTTNLLPYMGIPVYPTGNFLVGIYSTIISYHLVRRRIFDALVVANQITIKILVSSVFIGSYFFIVKVYRTFIGESTYSEILFHVSYFILSLEFYQILVEKIDKLREGMGIGTIYKKREILKKINSDILGVSDIERLISNLKHIITTNIGVKINSFYISGDLNIIPDSQNKEGFIKCFGEEIKNADLIELSRIIKNKKLELSIKCDEVDKNFFILMKRIDCQGFVPFIFNDKKIGFILLKARKKKGNYFFYEDMELFDDLVLKVGIALDRIRWHLVSLREREMSLKALAGSIAHEVRNPLGAIRLAISNSSLFFEGAINAVDKNETIVLNKEDLESIVENYDISLNSIKRANEIINITLNEVKGEKLDPKTFSYYNICDSIEQAVNEYGYRDKNERSKVINQLLAEGTNRFLFKGDETLFIYIIFNLLKNALYYLKSYPNSIVTIGESKNDEYNSIYIQDTGPGIKPEILKSLFGDFVTSGKKDGTGLGLAFCKRTMQAFGGDIKCESELGKYTKFIIYFPKLSNSELKEAHKIMEDRQNGKDVDAPKKKILMVDDQKVNLMVSKKLVDNNLQNTILDTVENGLEAIEILKKSNDYNLILMDIQMPEMDGYQTTREIRKFNKKIPIVAYTSRKSIEAKRDAADSGMSGYLAKPIDNSFFLRNVAKWALISNYGKRTDQELIDILQNKNILLIDDEATNRKITGKLLSKYKINVTEGTNGQEGLGLLTKDYDKFDLIITDINMPIMDGICFVKKIRQFEFENNYETSKRIGTIAMTGDRNEDLIYNILTSGFDDYLIKGEDHHEILNSMALLIKIKKDEGYLLSNLNIEQLAMVEKRAVIRSQPSRIKIDNELPVLLDEEKLSFFSQSEQQEVVESFLKSAASLVKEIETAKINNDVSKLFFDSHALKGISGNVGCNKLFKYISYINEFSRKESFPDDALWLEKLVQIFEESCVEYQKKIVKK